MLLGQGSARAYGASGFTPTKIVASHGLAAEPGRTGRPIRPAKLPALGSPPCSRRPPVGGVLDGLVEFVVAHQAHGDWQAIAPGQAARWLGVAEPEAGET